MCLREDYSWWVEGWARRLTCRVRRWRPSTGSDQRRPAEGRQWRPREDGMAAADGVAADFSGQAGRETWKRCEGLVRTGERGAGGVGGVVGRLWRPRTEARPGLASRRGHGGGGAGWGCHWPPWQQRSGPVGQPAHPGGGEKHREDCAQTSAPQLPP